MTATMVEARPVARMGHGRRVHMFDRAACHAAHFAGHAVPAASYLDVLARRIIARQADALGVAADHLAADPRVVTR